MAMHKKLDPGSILFTFHEAKPVWNQKKYRIEFNLIYVANRRERTTGSAVPGKIEGVLNRLGVRTIKGYRTDNVTAVGCRNIPYYKCESALPYPSAEQVIEAEAAFEAFLKDRAETTSLPLTEIEFVHSFKEKKMSNADSLFSLSASLYDHSVKHPNIATLN